MKSSLVIISFLISTISLAQTVDPDLIGTWYLREVILDDLGFVYIVENVTPPIQPTLTITEDFEFTGVGACNSFDGTFEIQPPPFFSTLTFNGTNIDCGILYHDNFETNYFGFMSVGGKYEVSNVADGIQLYMDTPLGGFVKFLNVPLSTDNFSASSIKVYPNPSKSVIHLESKNEPITKVECYDISGKKVQIVYDFSISSIDLSLLDSGIYLLKIYSELEMVTKKVIKQSS